MADSVTSALSNILRVEISRGIREARAKLDPVWEDLISTSFGVKRDEMGQSWNFKTAFVTGSAGAFEFMGAPTGPDLAYPSGDLVDAGVLGTPIGFPSRQESTVPGFFQKTVQLVEGRGNVFVPIKWYTLDRADGAVGSAVKAVVTGIANKVARSYALAFYTSDATNFKVVYDLAASGSAATHTIVIDNADSSLATGRIQQLEPGTVVDIYTAGVLVNLGGEGDGWVVTKVDYLAQTFVIATMGGTNRPILAADYLTLRGSGRNGAATAKQCAGLNTWIVNTGTVFGIDTALYPIFRSLIETQTGPLTERYLRNRIGAFIDRLGTVVDLDTILTPAGVVHAYMENEDNIMTIERNGRLLDMNHGWADIKFSYHGKPFRWAISTFIQPQSLYVTKFADNNIKEYLPPATPSMGSDAQFGDVEFAGPAGGLNGIWAHEQLTTAVNATPYASASSIADNLQAPFWRLAELCPEQMQSIKTTGFDES